VAQRFVLNGLAGLLEIVGLELMAEVVRAYTFGELESVGNPRL